MCDSSPHTEHLSLHYSGPQAEGLDTLPAMFSRLGSYCTRLPPTPNGVASNLFTRPLPLLISSRT